MMPQLTDASEAGQGHYAYYGITGNSRAIAIFRFSRSAPWGKILLPVPGLSRYRARSVAAQCPNLPGVESVRHWVEPVLIAQPKLIKFTEWASDDQFFGNPVALNFDDLDEDGQTAAWAWVA